MPRQIEPYIYIMFYYIMKRNEATDSELVFISLSLIKALRGEEGLAPMCFTHDKEKVRHVISGIARVLLHFLFSIYRLSDLFTFTLVWTDKLPDY